MKRITSRIIGYKRFKDRFKAKATPADKSYDMAYSLSAYLNKHRDMFTLDSDLIIYPYAWGNNFFVVLFRHKNGVTDICEFNQEVVLSLIGESISDKDWDLRIDSNCVDNKTPYYFKFYAKEV